MRPEDEEWVVDLWQRQYGHPNQKSVEAAAGDHQRVFGYIAMQGNQRAGFGISMVQSIDSLENMYDVDFRPFVSHKLNGLVYQICVAPGFESRGHGTRLFTDCTKCLANYDGCEIYHAVACSWQRRDAHDSSAILEKLGFERVMEREQLWGEHRTDCPDCEGDVCECDAAFYVRRFGRER